MSVKRSSQPQRSGGWRFVTMAMGLILGLWVALQWPVEFHEGVDFHVTTRTVPLYLKLARFISRDLEYRHLVWTLTRDARNDEEKLLRLSTWVRESLYAGVPTPLHVVDDHVWNIIVRRYGTSDQFADVLATLCAYAGLPAELVTFGPPGQPRLYVLALVEVDGRWCPLDPFHGVIIRRPDGRLASREDIRANPELARRASPDILVGGRPYAAMYDGVPLHGPSGELRPYRQMPLWRCWYTVQRFFHHVVPE